MWVADQVTTESVAQSEEKGEDKKAVECVPQGAGPQEAPHTALSTWLGRGQKEGPLVTVGMKESRCLHGTQEDPRAGRTLPV